MVYLNAASVLTMEKWNSYLMSAQSLLTQQGSLDIPKTADNLDVATNPFSYQKLNFRFFPYCTARQHPAQKASTQRHGQPAPTDI